jgi:hypothetical protein
MDAAVFGLKSVFKNFFHFSEKNACRVPRILSLSAASTFLPQGSLG